MSTYVAQRQAAEQRYADRRPLSKELFERASAVMPGGSTRSVLDMSPFPFRVASAAGSELVDVDGITYVDYFELQYEVKCSKNDLRSHSHPYYEVFFS